MRAILTVALMSLSAASTEIITQWNFNSSQADSDPATGQTEPSTGAGSLVIIGSLNSSFGSVASGASSDPEPADNSQLRLSAFPPQASDNKSAGFELRVSTAGFQNIRFTWDQENSGSASRFWRVQYTLDGILWQDHAVVTNSSSGTWQKDRSVDFESVPAAQNNPLFGLRFVSEFEDSATGSGAPEYRTVNLNGNYSTSGTLWLDMITLSGEALGPGNLPLETFVLWDFNSPLPDTDPATGSLDPSLGSGAPALPIGDARLSLGSVAGGASSDPSPDNSMLKVTGFPSATEGNLTTGIEFRASTAGYTNLVLQWDQYNSNTASRYWRLQYSTNGLDFLNHATFTNTVPSTWRRKNEVSFALAPGTADNPNFAIRLVSEFARTATGSGPDAYAAVNDSSSYSASGTLWLDRITLRAQKLAGENLPPTLSEIEPHIIRENTPTGPLDFSLSDDHTPPELLQLSAESSNPDLVSDVTFGGSGANRTVSLQPNPGQSGQALITLRVTDAAGLFAEKSFILIVLQGNTRPTISVIEPQTLYAGGPPLTVSFTVSDREQPASQILTSPVSSDPDLVEPGIEGAGTERILTLRSPAGAYGACVVTIRASDGLLDSEISFPVTILPIDPPVLRVLFFEEQLQIVWKQAPVEFHLEARTNLLDGTWQPLAEPVESVGGDAQIAVPPSLGLQFFRLSAGAPKP